MSVLAAWVGDDHTAVAADNRTSNGHSHHPSPGKVWRHQTISGDEFVIGFCGYADIGTRVRLGLKVDSTPPDASDEMDCWRWADSIASAVWELVTGRDGREDLRQDLDVERAEYVGLIAWRHRLYHLTSQGNASPEVRHYTAVGSGDDYAMGAMYATRDQKMTPEERVQTGALAACAHSLTCAEPVHVETMAHRALQDQEAT